MYYCILVVINVSDWAHELDEFNPNLSVYLRFNPNLSVYLLAVRTSVQ